jgi:hypothetical protein
VIPGAYLAWTKFHVRVCSLMAFSQGEFGGGLWRMVASTDSELPRADLSRSLSAAG